MQADIEESHQRQAGENGHRHQARDDQPGAQPQEQQHHHAHQHDRLEQVVQELVDAHLDPLGLVGQDLEGQADRQCLFQAGNQRGDLLAQVENVAAFAHGHGYRQPLMAAGVVAGGGRIGIAMANLEQRPQRYQGAVGERDQRVADVIEAGEVARGLDHQALVVAANRPAGQHDIAGGQQPRQPLRRDAKLGQACLTVLQKDALLGIAVQRDLGHVVEQQQPVVHVVGHLLELRLLKALAGQRQHDTEDIAELVIDDRR